MILNGLFFHQTLMLLRVIAFYSLSRHFAISVFSGGFLQLFKTSRDLCLTVARTNLRKYMPVFVISELLLEYGQFKSLAKKTFLMNCNLSHWNLDLTKCQGTGEICSLYRGSLYRGSVPHILL